MLIDRIDQLMSRHGISTYAECEKKCGLSNGTLGKWKKGGNKPTLRSLERLAEFFGVPIDYLLEENDEDGASGMDLNDIEFALLKETGEMNEDTLKEVLRFAKLMNKKLKEEK